MIALMNAIQRYLFDRSDDPPLPRMRHRRLLTKEERARRKRERERYERRQAFFFGKRLRRKRSRNLFHLVPDVPCEQVEADRELYELGQAVIYNRAAMIRETWSPNKQRKRNNYHVDPLVFNPISDDLHFDSRESE